MKKLLAFIGVAALLATITASAQIPTTGVGVIPTPTNYPAGVTNYPLSTAPTIGALKQQNVAFQSVITFGTAGGTNQFIFAPSIDGILFDTNAADCISFSNTCLTASGGSTNIVYSSFNTAGALYYKLIRVAVTGAVATNGLVGTNGLFNPGYPSLQYGVKISAP